MKLLKFAMIGAVLSGLAFGAGDTLAQTKKKPVLKRRTVVKRAPVKPSIPMYTADTGTVVRVRMNNEISSKTAAAGQTFMTTVTEPVYASNGIVIVPVGSTLTGKISSVQKAVKGGKPGSIDVNFTSVKLPNGRTKAINGSLTELNTKTAKSDDEGTASGDKMKHRKVIWYGGGAGGGALLGAAIGGGKGALIGGLIGAGAGFLGERYTKGENATIKQGTEFSVYLNQPLSLPKFVEVTP